MNTTSLAITLTAFLGTSLAGCSPDDPAEPPTHTSRPEGAPLVVAAVNDPLAYFAERIGGDAVRVVLPDLPGDPAFWNPPVEVIAEFQGADLIVRNGASYARWVDRASLPRSRMIDTTAAQADQLLREARQVTHAHGPGGEHVHSRTASTTWLDLSLAVEQARALRDALIELLPEREEPLRARFAELEQDLSELDTRLAAAAAQDAPLLASHPIYQYLARRYALDIHSVHWEPDEHPSPEQWSELEDLLRSHPARWMLWEGPPREETVAALAALGVGSVVFSPCGNTTEGSDFLRVMAQNVESLRATQGPPADAGADR